VRRYVAKDAWVKIKVLFLTFSILLGLYLLVNHTKIGCDSIEGKWASNGSYCITQQCYESGDCGNSAHPILSCKKLLVGDSIDKVYFNLGNPISIKYQKYTWQSSKGSDKLIIATIGNDKLTGLECPAT
jgi:hypothetical protein